MFACLILVGVVGVYIVLEIILTWPVSAFQMAVNGMCIYHNPLYNLVQWEFILNRD